MILAGSIGPFAVVAFSAFILCYLVTEQSYGVPLMAPFAPLIKNDLYDSMVKANLYKLKNRPQAFKAKDRVRLKTGVNNGK